MKPEGGKLLGGSHNHPLQDWRWGRGWSDSADLKADPNEIQRVRGGPRRHVGFGHAQWGGMVVSETERRRIMG